MLRASITLACLVEPGPGDATNTHTLVLALVSLALLAPMSDAQEPDTAEEDTLDAIQSIRTKYSTYALDEEPFAPYIDSQTLLYEALEVLRTICPQDVEQIESMLTLNQMAFIGMLPASAAADFEANGTHDNNTIAVRFADIFINADGEQDVRPRSSSAIASTIAHEFRHLQSARGSQERTDPDTRDDPAAPPCDRAVALLHHADLHILSQPRRASSRTSQVRLSPTLILPSSYDTVDCDEDVQKVASALVDMLNEVAGVLNAWNAAGVAPGDQACYDDAAEDFRELRELVTDAYLNDALPSTECPCQEE